MNNIFTPLFATLALVAAFLFTVSCGEHSFNELLGLDSSSSTEGGGYSSGSYVPPSDGGNSVLNKTVKVGYNIKNAADLADGLTDIVYLLKWYSDSPNATSTFVNEDGTVTVHVTDDDAKISHIYEFSMTLELQRQLSFPYEFDMFGAFTKDSDGNYYFFYGKVSRGENNIYVGSDEARNDPENMVMVKYDRSGRKIKTYKRKPVRDNWGVNTPFRVGCRLEVSGSMLAVYFARSTYEFSDGTAHQANYGFILNKDTFEEVNAPMQFFGHSFDQFILPINDGFVFADKGDGYPRAFAFAKYKNNAFSKTLSAFTFAGDIGDNTTNAQMGGLAETSGGYIFAGTYGEIPNRRNLFILTIDNAITAVSNPRYLTTYTESDNRSIGHPKIIGIGSQYLLLWELYEQTLSRKFSSVSDLRNNASSTKYLSTKMQIIDGTGNPLSPVKDLQGLRLNQGDFLRYNSRNGRVYWAIKSLVLVNSFTVYALDAQYAYTNDNFIPPEEPIPGGGTFTDTRDGKKYKTIEIGEQTWMAENLNIETGNSVCYDNDQANCEKYGRLYDWATAMEACPSGWHLPSNEEWEKLLRYADGTSGTESPYKSETAKKHLKELYFSTLLGGYRSNGSFSRLNSIGDWWTSTAPNSSNAYRRFMSSTADFVDYSSDNKNNYLFSVRCVED